MILTNYAIKFRTAVFVFIGVLSIAGGIAYQQLPREGTPDITIPYVFVTALYEGTSPEDMEKLVTIPLEKQFNDLENVKNVTSTSSEGASSVVIEYFSGQDIDMALQKVRDKVNLARPDLPRDLDEPIIQAINFSTDFPIFIFSLSGGGDLNRLKGIAEDLQDAIELVPGVRQASLAGIREREIRVEADLNRMIALNIPLDTITARIAAENRTISAGNIEVSGQKFQVRVPGEYKLAADLRDILLVERDGVPVYLRDVATVTDTYKDIDSISRINHEPCVSIEVKKRNRENSVRLIREVKSIIETFPMPAGIDVTYVMDESEYVDMMINELENNIVSGFILVVLVLLIFMGGRNSLFVATAIPLSMLIAFAIMMVRGTTLNMIVLFSLVLALGMLVDNAIVIVENIFRLRNLGLSRIEAARQGAAEVAWPVITSTATTCMAFAPLLFWPDIMGQFMSFLPITLIIVLCSSLFVAIVINPAVCSALISRSRRSVREPGVNQDHPFIAGYERFLRTALRHRAGVLVLGFMFLFFSFEMYAHLDLGFELFPEVEPRNAEIKVKFPQGTAIETTDAAMREIEALLPAYPDIKFFLTKVGIGGGGGFSMGSSAPHEGRIHVEFLPSDQRQTNTMELVYTLRNEMPKFPGAEITVDRQEEGPPTGAPVSIELSGEDFDELARLSADIIRHIEHLPGLVDLQDDHEAALPELQFVVNRNRAALLGLDTQSIGHFLRSSIYGLETSKFRADQEEYDITLRLPREQRDTFDLLDRIHIPLASGLSVPLSSLGEVVYTGGKGSINRKNQKRVITINGNNQGRGVDVLIKEVRALLDDFPLPQGYSIRYAGDTEEMQKSMAFLSRAFLVALGLILTILVVQFNSVFLPLIILFSVVLSMIGVTWGLLITQMKFGIIMTGLGVISLAGIVVNNAIVLIDCVRQRREEGLSTDDAVVAAGRLRLRPVLLTAVTTILGLIPMAVGYSLEIHEWPPRFISGAETSAWWAPMAVAVIFGLAASTVLTLILVPVMYSLFDGVAAGLRRRFGGGEEP
ncbi:MAG TPA: efflux RND transporter permease subunit [Kiritimatiellia bacterium]|nr:efflux RND transporter permease subunit [Kiritimatiellia bacterium]HMO98189.1 efflux RND transporter permease subunit [Kiritimatiellia bacterium]HMP97474.1 efflux RND transporter permease subunit [Kiritimatiellia bacterium]